MPAKQRMHLLLISRAHNGAAGGMERLSFELVQELKKISELTVTTLVHSGTSHLGAIFFVLRSLLEALHCARRADVIHLGDPVLALHGWLIRKLFKKPVAVTVHGLDVTFRNPLYQLYLRLFGQFDLAVPISNHAAKLMQKSKLRIQNSRVITPGVHDRYFDQSMARASLESFLLQAASYKLPTNQKVLFTAGRLVKRKGHAWFIENVLPHLPENTVYIVAGNGPERALIEEAARTSHHKVLLLGRVRDEDLKILYNTVDAFVQPNIAVPGDAEGFGLVLLEAALCQRPVFASRLDGIPDAIHDGKNGTLLPTGNSEAWIAALSTPLTQAPTARDYTLQHFGWSAQAQKYYQALCTMVAIPSDKD